MEKISRKSVTLWRIRLCAASLACILATFFAFTSFPTARTFFISAEITAFLLVCFIYYPAKYKGFAFGVDEDVICVKSGVIFRCERYMHLECIQYVNLVAGPLQRAMGLSGIQILAAGTKIYIPCLEKEKIQNLLRRLGR